MGDETGIGWTNKTWNPWQGCAKVSPACANCYMYRDKKRYGQDPTTVVRSARATFRKPLSKKWSEPGLVFTCSWSDFFHAGADPWREDAWRIIEQTPHLTYQILTKRPERILGRLPSGWPLDNVWLGVTVETADYLERIHYLAEVSPCVAFVSMEPLLGPVDLTGHLDMLDWVIVGGESGAGSRPMDPDWVRLIRDQCVEAGVPFFFKQWGAQQKGHELDGQHWEQFPSR
jgi:protein gp37